MPPFEDVVATVKGEQQDVHSMARDTLGKPDDGRKLVACGIAGRIPPLLNHI